MGCVNDGLKSSSNDNARPTGVNVFGPWVGDALVVSVLVCALGCTVAISVGVVGAEMLFVGAFAVVATGVDVVAVFTTDAGFAGDTGLATFVGLVTDFVQVLAVVVHDPLHVGCA